MLARIKKDDLVEVLSGRDKGKKGNVVSVDPKEQSVVVKGVGIVTRHVKAKKHGEKSRITREEGMTPMCKLMPVCPSCKKTCRVQVRVLDDQQKVRSCHRCKEAF